MNNMLLTEWHQRKVYDAVHVVVYTSDPAGAMQSQILRILDQLHEILALRRLKVAAVAKGWHTNDVDRIHSWPSMRRELEGMPLDWDSVYLCVPNEDRSDPDFDEYLAIEFNSVRPDPGRSGFAGTPMERMADSCVTVSMRRQYLADDPGGSTAAILEVVRVLSESLEPYYGFVECEDIRETHWRSVYGTVLNGPINKRIAMEEAVWWRPDTDRSRCVRGVYWGNLLSQDLVERLGGADAVCNPFLDWRFCNPAGRLVSVGQQVARLTAGSVFLCLSDNVWDGSPSDGMEIMYGGRYVALKGWLRALFRRHNVLA